MNLKNPFLELILLLLIALGVITAYSFLEKPITVELRQSEAADYFRPDTTAMDSILVESLDLNATPVMDTAAQSILLIGDSMLEGLSPRLLEYAMQNGHELNSVVWYSSTTKYFGQSDTLAYFIKKHKPTYVLLSLGANELFVKNIKKDRLEFVRHIIKTIDTIPYVWIGPPNWKDDTGINEMIVENTGRRRYYPSKRLKFDRAKDGAHPTHTSSAKWIDSLAVWISDSSAHPIRLAKPEPEIKRKGNGIRTILQPIK